MAWHDATDILISARSAPVQIHALFAGRRQSVVESPRDRGFLPQPPYSREMSLELKSRASRVQVVFPRCQIFRVPRPDGGRKSSSGVDIAPMNPVTPVRKAGSFGEA